MCTLPLLAGENVSARVRRADGGEPRSTSSSTSRSSATGAAGSARSSPCPAGPEGDVVEIADLFVRRGRGAGAGATGSRRTPTASSGPGYDLAALLAQGRGVTGLARRAAPGRRAVPASGGRCWVPAGRGAARRARRSAGLLALLGDDVVQAGFAGLTRAHRCSTACVLAFALVLVIVWCRRRGSRRRASASRSMAGCAPVALVRPRARRRRGRLRDALAGGRRQHRLGRAGRAGAAGGPRPARRARSGGAAARRSPRSPRTTGSPGGSQDCLDRLKERLGDPVADRLVEALRIAREVGGSDLGRLLRTLSALPARGCPHPRRAARPGRPGRSTPPGSPSPRRGSCSRCCRPGRSRSPAYAAGSGWPVLAVGGAVTVRRVPRDGAASAGSPRTSGCCGERRSCRAGALLGAVRRSRPPPRVGGPPVEPAAAARPSGCCPTCATPRVPPDCSTRHGAAAGCSARSPHPVVAELGRGVDRLLGGRRVRAAAGCCAPGSRPTSSGSGPSRSCGVGAAAAAGGGRGPRCVVARGRAPS